MGLDSRLFTWLDTGLIAGINNVCVDQLDRQPEPNNIGLMKQIV